jgi:uncharacterized protein YdcH (DUF465 family)
MRELEIKYHESVKELNKADDQIAQLLDELNSYESKVMWYSNSKKEACEELNKLKRETLSLAKGDKLLEGADNNCLIVEKLINRLREIIKEDCEDDSRARLIAREVLSGIEVEGDSRGVPSLGDIVEKLVFKINQLEGDLEEILAK